MNKIKENMYERYSSKRNVSFPIVLFIMLAISLSFLATMYLIYLLIEALAK